MATKQKDPLVSAAQTIGATLGSIVSTIRKATAPAKKASAKKSPKKAAAKKTAAKKKTPAKRPTKEAATAYKRK